MASQETIDLVARGRAVYDAKCRNSLESTNSGDFVAVEPESEEFFLGKTLSEAIQAARAVHADRLPVVFRLGHKAAIEIGVLNARPAKWTAMAAPSFRCACGAASIRDRRR